MARSIGIGLARVTVAAPHSRLDVALPEHVPVTELLPGLLRRAGGDLADNGQQHGGWVLRRADGAPVDGNRTLAAQNVLDGEVLYLVARRTEWPEPEFDDLVDAIAVETRRHARAWSPHSTRVFGLGSAALFLSSLLAILVALGPPWTSQGVISIAIATTLLVAGVLLSRVLSDNSAGAALAALALAFSVAGLAMLDAGRFPISEVGSAVLLAGCGGLFAASIIADVGVASGWPLFVAGSVVAILGAFGALLRDLGLTAPGAASVIASVIVVFAPVLPLASLRLAKIPTPNVPATTEDLLNDEELPTRRAIHARVVRCDQLLTGFLEATSFALSACMLALILSRDGSSVLLAVVICGSLFLRARFYPTLHHRLPLLLAGLAGCTMLGYAAMSLSRSHMLFLTAAGAGLAIVAITAGLVYSRRRAGPSMGRLGDVIEVLFVLSVVPIACAVLGVYGRMRGLAG